MAASPATINGHCKAVLERSPPFTTFPKTHSCDWQPETHTLVVQYDLPAIGCVPQARASWMCCKFQSSRRHPEGSIGDHLDPIARL